MLSGRVFLCLVLITVWHESKSASVPLLQILRSPPRPGLWGADDDGNSADDVSATDDVKNVAEGLGLRASVAVMRARVREGVPPPLCVGRCALPPAGPVCAFDATGTARTFATLCELEAVSCRESTYYAITTIGEC